MKNWKIGTRLTAGFGLVLCLATLMTGIGIWRLQAVADATHDMMQQPLAKERMIGDWYLLIHTSVRRVTAVAKSTDTSLGAFFTEDTAASVRDVAELQKKIEPLLVSDKEKSEFAAMSQTRLKYIASRAAIEKLKLAGKFDEAADELQTKLLPLSKQYLESLRLMRDVQRQTIDADAEQIDAIYRTSRSLLIGLGVVVLLFGALCAWRLTLGIIRPLSRAVAIARTVASNDLSSRIEVDSTDETGQLLAALQHMNDSLARVVGEVRTGSASIATASSEIAAGNLDLSKRTEHQAGSLEETASSMEELTATVRQNADHARQANALAQAASTVALRGGSEVSQLVDTMGAINQSSRKIVEIISVIDGIAFQTNILALNAAVEAARAGEQGRGFAVVATEVRSLAQRSATAAKEIKVLIDASVEQVDTGSKLVERAGAIMSEVVSSVGSVSDIIGEITTASQEQSHSIEQVNRAIAQMDQVTQQNAALVEQASAAAGALQEQAAGLSEMVGVFKLGADQRATQATRRAPQPARGFAPRLLA
ncbi:methyl-accepting chemotaxis protein [Rugamonas sp.]|uniref:methyl-accepting chemotaxis protein n=1 Tax=Rugamonas sp. TaxID=1926287 RepID=UPI0025E8E878|nr:methyl-accepting chemotaxis protein [Rugamonas sp.]